MTQRHGFLRMLLLAPLATLLVTGCGSAPRAPAGGPVAVVAGENFWGDIVRQIGGPHVTVTSIITDPSADPHSYETNPQDAAAVASATLIVENGAGYDSFLDKLVSAGTGAGSDVLVLATVVGLKGDNPNPHIWYDPAYVTAAARAIERRLAADDAPDAALFHSTLQSFLTSYQPYVDALATIRTRHGGAPIAYTERVPGYLVAAAGLRLATPASFAQAVEDGNDPSPADAAAMEAVLANKSVKVLLYNAQVNSPTTQKVRDIAMANRIPVVAVTETLPQFENSFQAWQVSQAMALLTALGG